MISNDVDISIMAMVRMMRVMRVMRVVHQVMRARCSLVRERVGRPRLSPVHCVLCIVHCRSVECIFSSPPLGVQTGWSVSTWSAIDFEQCAINDVTQRIILVGTLDSHRATTLTIEGKKERELSLF